MTSLNLKLMMNLPRGPESMSSDEKAAALSQPGMKVDMVRVPTEPLEI